MEINPIVEGRKKFELLFVKFEQVLEENELVISALLAKQYKSDEDVNERDLVSTGS